MKDHEVRFALAESTLAAQRPEPGIGVKDVEVISEHVSKGSVDRFLGTVLELGEVDVGNHARHQFVPIG